jgi:methionyl-tRNA formyltransferase
MRLIVMGTGPFAVPTLQYLLDAGHEIALVVTRPQPESTSKKAPPRPVFQWAVERGFQPFEPPSINAPEAIDRLRSCAPDLFFVCDYGQILSNDCLTAAKLGGINLHGSLLPRHRGAAPVQWSLLRGDSHSGVTVIHMTPRLDAGPALSVRITPIEPDETAAELEPRLAMLGVEATAEAIGLLRAWDGTGPLGVLQDQSLVTRAPRFSKADGQLDCRLPAEYLLRLYRACQPWPGCFAELQWPSGKLMRLLVKGARVQPTAATEPGGLLATPVGTAQRIEAATLGLDWPSPNRTLMGVNTGEGVLLISRLQPAGKREMDAEEFLRGHPLEGQKCRFLLPAEPVARLDQR